MPTLFNILQHAPKSRLYNCQLVRTITLKPVFHFNRIVAKRRVFNCFVNTQAELMIWGQ